MKCILEPEDHAFGTVDQPLFGSGLHLVRETMRNSPKDTKRHEVETVGVWGFHAQIPYIAGSPDRFPKPGVAGSIPAEGAI
jgi:hypothetical protein